MVNVACVVDVRNAFKILDGKPEGKRSLGLMAGYYRSGS
jgi:hypothetical protein